MGLVDELLLGSFISADQAKVIKEQMQVMNQSCEQLVVSLGFVSASVIKELVSQKYSLKNIDLSKTSIDSAVVKTLNKDYCIKHQVLPFARSDFSSNQKQKILVAAADPISLSVKDYLQKTYDAQIEVFLAQSHDILEKINLIFEKNTIKAEKWIELIESAELNDSFATDMIYRLIEHCVLQKASDIHIEPQELFVRIRLRKDGVLEQLCVFSKKHYPSLCVRLKLLCNMDISQTFAPQDGRFDCYVVGKKVDLRVSTRPVMWGENFVIRILDGSAIKPDFDLLGYSEDNKQKLNHIMNQTSGIFIVTGPTGSGKSTLLFSMLDKMCSEKVSIATIEDPVEKVHPHFRQTDISVYKQMTFASTFKAILRQDPDIISISEIRDQETASLAVRAAMTGRMVLTTLHTNDIFGIFDRLLDLGVSKNMLAHHLCGVATQRLVRLWCDKCLGKSCLECSYTGYKGRKAVCQVLVIDQQIKDMLLEKNINQVKQQLYNQGFKPFREHLLELVQTNQTSLEEINRVFSA